MNSLYQEMTTQVNNQNNSNLANYPKYAEVMKELKESGLTAQQLFFKKTKEMGIDPMGILSQIR